MGSASRFLRPAAEVIELADRHELRLLSRWIKLRYREVRAGLSAQMLRADRDDQATAATARRTAALRDLGSEWGIYPNNPERIRALERQAVYHEEQADHHHALAAILRELVAAAHGQTLQPTTEPAPSNPERT